MLMLILALTRALLRASHARRHQRKHLVRWAHKAFVEVRYVRLSNKVRVKIGLKVGIGLKPTRYNNHENFNVTALPFLGL